MSGAEQDRYGGKFGVPQSTIDKAKDYVTPSTTPNYTKQNFGLGYDGRQRLLHLANKQGVGAEQERYGKHFSLDGGHIKSIGNAFFEVVNTKGVGAEQDRYGAHFKIDEKKVQNAKETAKEFFVGGR
ncbi:hypothetical protein EJ08DRAFT_732460 [Tothia fuscella]|uniref:Uncharacterized protein n=1 Tax=Tothia fuscella TaxID=1048955 RepID=A0A9P4NVX7_9PEZI|nr:hypothetical protein EJ08DRAFT_732460 [Tothia fuscella]